MDSDTPLPGMPCQQDKQGVISDFKASFRQPYERSDTPTNLPTSCLLPAPLKNLSVASVLESTTSPVFILFEYDDDLRIATADEIIIFANSLQPWEDYDFCVFDSSMQWCVAMTHNGDVKRVVKK